MLLAFLLHCRLGFERSPKNNCRRAVRQSWLRLLGGQDPKGALGFPQPTRGAFLCEERAGLEDRQAIELAAQQRGKIGMIEL